MLFNILLVLPCLLMAIITKQHHVVTPVTFELIREMLPIQRGHHVEPRVVALCPANHALILPECGIKVVVV